MNEARLWSPDGQSSPSIMRPLWVSSPWKPRRTKRARRLGRASGCHERPGGEEALAWSALRSEGGPSSERSPLSERRAVPAVLAGAGELDKEELADE